MWRSPPSPSPGQRCRRNAELWRVEEAEESPSSQRRSPPPGLGAAAAARSQVGGGGGQERAGQAASRSWDSLQECSPLCQGNLGRLFPTNGFHMCFRQPGVGGKKLTRLTLETQAGSDVGRRRG